MLKWRVIIIPKKFEEISLKSFQKIAEQVEKLQLENSKLNTKINDIQKEMNQRINDLESQLTQENKEIKKVISNTEEKIEETIKVQEDIIMGMMHKFNEEFYNHKTIILKELEALKNEQDVLKISYTINENKLIEQIKSVVKAEFNNKIKGLEAELLMKLWIDDLKEIISNFENLKKVNPKEFTVQLREISDTITAFKQKIGIE
jgi:hypothetical protein